MKWKEDYATGVPEIDKQHRALFELSEEFRETLESGAGEKTYDLFLDFLKTYCEVHFDFEEKCMLAHLCPVADRNRNEHAMFSRMIAREIEDYETHGFDRDRAMKALDTLDHWLDSHICRVDIKLRDCLD